MKRMTIPKQILKMAFPKELSTILRVYLKTSSFMIRPRASEDVTRDKMHIMYSMVLND